MPWRTWRFFENKNQLFAADKFRDLQSKQYASVRARQSCLWPGNGRCTSQQHYQFSWQTATIPAQRQRIPRHSRCVEQSRTRAHDHKVRRNRIHPIRPDRKQHIHPKAQKDNHPNNNKYSLSTPNPLPINHNTLPKQTQAYHPIPPNPTHSPRPQRHRIPPRRHNPPKPDPPPSRREPRHNDRNNGIRLRTPLKPILETALFIRNNKHTPHTRRHIQATSVIQRGQHEHRGATNPRRKHAQSGRDGCRCTDTRG